MKMVTDLKLEIFAYNIFQTVFQSHRLLQYKPSIEIYGNACLGDPSYAEVYDDLFHKAIFCRRELFQIVYKGDIMHEKIESCKSLSDLLDYLINRCDQDDLFPNLCVFERMFATCAFVVSMCVHIYWYNIVDVITYGHLFWSLFFDKYTEEFYKEGGWNQLKRVAKTYEFLYEFLALFPENFDNYFRALKEASVNYRRFKEVIFSKEHKHVSKIWVKFRIENFENYVNVPVSYEISLSPIKTEFLLKELKQYCDPRPKEAHEYYQFRVSGSELNCFNGFVSATDDSESDNMSSERYRVKRVNEFVSRTDDSWNSSEDSDSSVSQGRYQVKGDEFLLYTDVSSSSVDDSDSDDTFQERYQGRYLPAGMASDALEICTEIKTNDNDLRFQPLLLSHKNKIVDTFSGKISNSSIKNNKNPQRENGESTSRQFESIAVKSSNSKSLEYFITNNNRDLYSEIEIGTTNSLNSRNTAFQREVANVVESTHVLGNQRVKSVWEAKNLRFPKDLVNEHISIEDERKSTEKIGNVNFDSRNREINETVKSKDILFTNLKTRSEFNAETSPDIVHNLEDLDVVNGYVSSDDGYGSIIKTTSGCLDSRKKETNETFNSSVTTKMHEKTSANISCNSKVTNDLNTKINSEDGRKIFHRKLDALRNELDDPSFNQFSRTCFKSADMEAIGYIPVTSFTEEEILEYSSEIFKNSNKRTRNEHEVCKKKFSPERKELENEMSSEQRK